jgi:hypothetical protein
MVAPGVAKSSVSRGFVRASAAAVKRLAERRFDSERFAVVMIDGVEYAGETLTVVRLGVPGSLRRTLATTNPIESALSVTRRVTARVTRWRDGDMRRRWCAAGLLRAEAKFRRVKGHRAMPALLKALEAVVRGDRVESGGPVCENARRNHTFASRAETPPCKRERL